MSLSNRFKETEALGSEQGVKVKYIYFFGRKSKGTMIITHPNEHFKEFP